MTMENPTRLSRLDISYFRQLPVPRLAEIVRGAAVVKQGDINYKDLALALLERIEDAKGYPRSLYEDY